MHAGHRDSAKFEAACAILAGFAAARFRVLCPRPADFMLGPRAVSADGYRQKVGGCEMFGNPLLFLLVGHIWDDSPWGLRRQAKDLVGAFSFWYGPRRQQSNPKQGFDCCRSMWQMSCEAAYGRSFGF